MRISETSKPRSVSSLWVASILSVRQLKPKKRSRSGPRGLIGLVDLNDEITAAKEHQTRIPVLVGQIEPHIEL